MWRPRNPIMFLLSAILIVCITSDINPLSSAYKANAAVASNTSVIDKAIAMRCKYTTNYHFGSIMNAYTCEVSGRIEITRRGTIIDNVTGTHLTGAAMDSVIGFRCDASIIHYLPKDLNKVFPNLQAILVNLAQLRVIRQSDLRPFPDLQFLDLFENDIEFLEADLFRYNRKLEVVWLSNNKIKFVDDSVFEGLSNLDKLYMGYNQCISKSVAERTRIPFLRDLIKIVCGNKSKNAKFDPKLAPPTEDVIDEDPGTDASKKGLSEAELQIDSLTVQVRTLEAEVFKLKARREQALMWLAQTEDENKLLKKAQNDSALEIQTLKDRVRLAESSSIDYNKQIFGLRDDLRQQVDATNAIVSDIKNQMANDQDRLKSQKEEIARLKEQNSKSFGENQKIRDNYENLLVDKETRDTVSLFVIVILVLCIIGFIGYELYTKKSNGTVRTFNDFENASLKLVNNDRPSGSIN